MPKWRPHDETRGPMSKLIRTQEEQGGCLVAMNRPWAILICDAHNADIDALTAERDELQRRLDAVVDSLKPDGPPIPGGMFDKEVRVLWRAGIELHTKALAIAEGRTP